MHTKLILENQALIMRALSHLRAIPDDITKELIDKSNSTKLLSKATV